MAQVKGAPKLPGSPELLAEFEFRGAYQGGAEGLGLGRIPGYYDYAGDIWRSRNNGGAPLDLPLGKEGSPAPASALVITFYALEGAPDMAVLPVVSPGKDYLDLRDPHYAEGYIPSRTLEQLVTEGGAVVAMRPALEAAGQAAQRGAADAAKAAAEARGAVEAYNGTALYLVGSTARGPIVTAINADRLQRDAIPLRVMGKPRQVKVIAVKMGAE